MRSIVLLLFLLVPCFLHNESDVQAPLPVAAIQGIDVSHYQSYIQWDTIAAAGIVDFAFVKATEGADHIDTLFSHNWDELSRLGIRRGAYHFFRAYGCGFDQAEHFLSQVQMCSGDLAPVLDVERIDGMPQEVLREEMRVWLQIVEQRLNVKPIIYTNQNFYERYLAGYFDDNPLWIARYSSDTPILSTGKMWDFWQYTHTGRVNGIPDFVDMNIFNGSPKMLESLCFREPDSTAARPLNGAAILSAP